ncbi:hypothetical protein [Methylobacter sp. YRD-M1]|uniref:hypothetical protein n=1 Tax=Methylobacter sp. YRD-M1 TaxID=2911520 RepID=UPI00227A2267|nr:hypothetical protein [Methylobacter sp. YRD-M1]WAK02282.1 hypothetical protein LZ558_00445 [Methylobacter sp. YRD-M1]
MKLPVIQMLCAIALSGAVGMASADEGKDESGKGRGRHSYERDWKPDKGRYDDRWEGGDHGSYFHEHGYTHLDIPPGHYPPPGECRIWYPDRPAGHQPPPGDCGHVPPGAWVIRHPRGLPGRVHVNVYEPDYPGRVHVIGEFDIGSGQFIRIILKD